MSSLYNIPTRTVLFSVLSKNNCQPETPDAHYYVDLVKESILPDVVNYNCIMAACAAGADWLAASLLLQSMKRNVVSEGMHIR